MRITKFEVVYHDDSGEPYMKADLTSWDKWSLLYKLFWLAKCWRRLDVKMTVEKEARRR